MRQLWWLKDNSNPLHMVSGHIQELSPADMEYIRIEIYCAQLLSLVNLCQMSVA